jgi:uncharacterized protein (TIGR03083 family)
MEQVDYLAALEREAAAMCCLVESADLDDPVPTCPGWTIEDLVVHTGVVHRHKTATVRDGWLDGPPPRPDGPDGNVIEWFGDGIEAMLAVFAGTDLSEPTWTWCGHSHDCSWWVRRMAHETLIHGADAAIAAGVPPVVDEALATDGIEEVLVEMMTGAPEWAALAEGDEMIEIATPARSWTLRTGTWSGESPGTGTTYVDEPALLLVDATESPNLRITGSGADIDLWLWGRGDLPEGAPSGDERLVDLVRSVAAEATQ